MNVMPEYYNYFQLTTTTEALNTSISSVGGCVASLFSGFLVDWRGRRESIFWSALIPLVGAIIQTAAQNFGMFIAGRFIIGLGMGFASTATPIYVAETTPPNHRAFALGVYYSCWSVGTMMASGICYGVRTIRYKQTRLTSTESICSKHLGLAHSKLNPNCSVFALHAYYPLHP